ncbi:MAG: RloB domain-containing protein [Bacteroidales bacterium]|nr:RloB domain-containing protein [Bacteroidales bacterium]
MSRTRREPRGKKINPHFWVFCEGETEEAYVKFLRSNYRLHIEIIPKIVGNKITEKFIKNYKKDKPIHEKDVDFLIYDADVPELLEKLKKIKNTVLIASNPSIELWFLLHYKNQKAEISATECIKELCNRNRNTYKKGLIDNKLASKLNENKYEALKRAKNSSLFQNPSSNMNELIDILDKIKRN